MADLQTKSFSTLVSEQATAVQGGAFTLVDFTIGSILRAIIEAFAAVVLWLQGLVLQVLAVTRASTSSGADLDSWVADFGVVREAADAATGPVMFGRYTPTSQTTIAPGYTVQTADGSVQYVTVADAARPAWSTDLGVYVLAPGVTSIDVTVQCATAGAAGNVSAGVITTLGSAVAGIDYCTNETAFSNGAPAETDTALRTRFVAFLASLAKATKAAIGYAITALQQNYSYTITENVTAGGASRPGYFYVTVNDGSGAPSSGVLSQIEASVDAIRACGVQFSIYGPTTFAINASLNLIAAEGYDHSDVASDVELAIAAYIAGLPIGSSLSYSRIYAVIYGVAGVSTASLLLVNGGTADIPASAQQVLVAGTITVG